MADKKNKSKATVITLANQKGGCGKTTTAISLAAALAKAGWRVCLCDLDSQTNSTDQFPVTKNELEEEDYTDFAHDRDAYDIYEKEAPADTVIVPVPRDFFGGNLWIIRGNKGLDQVHGQLEAALLGDLFKRGGDTSGYAQDDARKRHRDRLNKCLQPIKADFDFVIIDTAPALDYLLTTALEASDYYIIPTFPSAFDLDGLNRLRRTAKTVKKKANDKLKLLGVVLGNFHMRTAMDKKVYAILQEQFPDEVFETAIGDAVANREATVHRLTIFEHAPDSKPAKQFESLVDEILERIKPGLSKKKPALKKKKANAKAAEEEKGDDVPATELDPVVKQAEEILGPVKKQLAPPQNPEDAEEVKNA